MKVLFVGLGSIGARHIKDFYEKCLQNDENIEIDVLRRNVTPVDAELSKLICRQITVLDETYYDVVFITNPTNLHFDALRSVKGKTKYYFIEKPIFDSCDYVWKELDIDSKNAYIAAPMRHTKVYKALKSIIDNNKVYSVRVICSSYLPEWRPKIDYRKNYSAIREMGGGVSLDLIHELDYIVDLFGFPSEEYCVRGKYSDLEIDSDDLATYILIYPDMLCEIHLDYFGREYRRQCEIFTKQGTYVADFYAEEVVDPTGKKYNYKDIVDAEFKNEMDYFWQFIHNSVEVFNSPEHAYDTLRIALGK